MSYKHRPRLWWRDLEAEGREASEAQSERRFGRLLYKDEHVEVRERATFYSMPGRPVVEV